MTACILCGKNTVLDYYRDDHHHFLKCNSCTSVFRNPLTYLDSTAEKERYLTHNNDVNDAGYQQFVAPIVAAVVGAFSIDKVGLDFGAGTGPVITKLLFEKGYSISLYDPFFHSDKVVLSQQYDFIVCCEVIEHFHNPLEEFKRLRDLLKPSGKLMCMTDMWNSDRSLVEFEKWYYKNDPTHVLFYNHENLQWIKKNAGYDSIVQEGRLITFTNKS